MPGEHEILNKMTFEEVEGGTKVVAVTEYDDSGVMEAMLRVINLEEGANNSWDHLANLVEK